MSCWEFFYDELMEYINIFFFQCVKTYTFWYVNIYLTQCMKFIVLSHYTTHALKFIDKYEMKEKFIEDGIVNEKTQDVNAISTYYLLHD